MSPSLSKDMATKDELRLGLAVRIAGEMGPWIISNILDDGRVVVEDPETMGMRTIPTEDVITV